MFQHGSRTSNDSSQSGDGDVDDEQSTLPPTSVPYQIPPNLPSFDARIQLTLEVQQPALKKTTKRRSRNKNKNTPSDFYVLLIDPRHSRSKLQKFVRKTLQWTLEAQGYRPLVAVDDNDNTNESTPTSATTNPQQHNNTTEKRPFCFCLLRNFRDVRPTSNDVKNQDRLVEGSELTAWTLEALQGYDTEESNQTHFDAPPPLLLQCVDVSLLNCYGLGQLHHFIYQSYIQKKYFDAQQVMHTLSKAATLSRQAAPTVVPYPNYLADLDRLVQLTQPAASGAVFTPNDDETDTTATSSGAGPSSRRRAVLPMNSVQQPQYRQHQQLDTSMDHDPDTGDRRQSRGPLSWGEASSQSTLPSMQQSLDNAKDALEAFLESDSDRDDSDGSNISSPEQQQPVKRNDTRDETDDDDASYNFDHDDSHCENTSEHEIDDGNNSRVQETAEKDHSTAMESHHISSATTTFQSQIQLHEKCVSGKDCADPRNDSDTVVNHIDDIDEEDAGDDYADNDGNCQLKSNAPLAKDVGAIDEDSDSDFFIDEMGDTLRESSLNIHSPCTEVEEPSSDPDQAPMYERNEEGKVVHVTSGDEATSPDPTDVSIDASPSILDSAVSDVNELSEAARAAIAAAQQDFEKMMLETEPAKNASRKKSKREKDAKKSKKSKKATRSS